MDNTYEVTVAETDGGPDAALRERLARVAAYRLETLAERHDHHPQAGGAFDMLDHLDGPFFWERTDEEMVDNPPSRVDFDVLAVDPVARPATPGTVRVTVRIAH